MKIKLSDTIQSVKTTKPTPTQTDNDFLPDVPEPPKTVQTDPPSVSEKRKTPPSPKKMHAAYQWLCSFDMEFRVRGRCTPETKCQFLIDGLPNDLRQEFEERGELLWRDWNTCYTLLKEMI